MRKLVEHYRRMLIKFAVVCFVIMIVTFALSFIVEFLGYISIGATCVTAALLFAAYLMECILREGSDSEDGDYYHDEDDSNDSGDQYSDEY